MRVLIGVLWDQKAGGVASVVHNLGAYLRQQGDEALFLHPGETPDAVPRTTLAGFRGFGMRLRPPFVADHPLRSVVAFWLLLPRSLWRLRALLRAQEIDVVNVHYVAPEFVYFALLRWLLGTRLVVSVHGSDLLDAGKRRARYSIGVRALLAAADRIVAPSRAMADALAAIFPRCAARTQVIPNGVDFDALGAPTDAPNPPSKVERILSVATYSPTKGIDILLRAFARARRRYPRLTLTLAGDGPSRDEYERLAAELGVDAAVSFLDHEDDRKAMGVLLRTSHLVVLASRSESFGLAAVEAMAFGRPVVASAVGGLPEVIEHERTGILVPPEDPSALADAIVRIIEDEELRARVCLHAHRVAHASFGAPRNGERYAELLTALGSPPQT